MFVLLHIFLYYIHLCTFSFHNHGRCHTLFSKLNILLLIGTHVYINCVCRLLRFFLEKFESTFAFTFTRVIFRKLLLLFTEVVFFTKYFYFY